MPLRLAVFMFLLSGLCCAQQYRMDHFTIREGLSQNTVNCVLKDSEGYYWLGTQDGLDRYDGYSIKVFRNDRGDSNTVSDNFILQVVEDAWGNLWIGTRNGLNHYNKKTSTFTRIWLEEDEKKKYHSSTRLVMLDEGGNILFNSLSLGFGIISNEDAESPPFSPVRNEGKKLLSCLGRGYTVYDGVKETMSVFSLKGTLTKAFPLPKEEFKKLSTGGSLALVDHLGNKLLDKATFSFLKEKKVNVVYMDSRSNTWIGTSEGLYLLNNKKEEPILLSHKEGDIYSLSSNGVESIYEDNDGLIWIGTSEGGVNVYDPEKEVFGFLDHNTTVKLPSSPVWAIKQIKNELWVGTSGGAGHLVYKKENASSLATDLAANEIFGEAKICEAFITSIETDKTGRIWFGTRSKGISIYDPGSKKWTYFNKENAPMKTDIIQHLYCDSDGDMWICTQAGFYCYKAMDGTFDSFLTKYYDPPKGLPSGYIFSAYRDKKGDVWIGSTAGLYRYNKAAKSIRIYESVPGDTSSMSYNMATSCYEDLKGRFWVATLGGGINLMDREKGTFKSFTKKHGLANDIVYSILEDSKGSLWISTNGGLSCFNPANVHFTNFGVKEGIISNEFVQNAAFKNDAGQMMFGTPQGMFIFHPDSVRVQQRDLPIVLTDLRVNYKSVPVGKEIDLHYLDKTIAFEFAAIDFRSRDKISYAFKLEGFDQGWNEVSSSLRVASYSNLPFGDYIFKVRIKTANMPWQEKQFALNLHVIPPFWLKAWFIVFEIMVVLLLLGALIKYFAQRKLKAKLRDAEVQYKIQLERERISRDLHDNVGSNLTYIISSLDNLNDRIEKLPSGQSRIKIESLGEFTRSTMQQLRETIWVINKESVSLAEFREKVREHLVKMLSNEGAMKFTVEMSGDGEIKLKPSLAIHLFRIVQEAVNNAIKHSGAAGMQVDIAEHEGKYICVIVKDTGKGFQTGANTNGHYGLLNMKARAEEMGGEFLLETEPGKGTTLKLIVPV